MSDVFVVAATAGAGFTAGVCAVALVFFGLVGWMESRGWM